MIDNADKIIIEKLMRQGFNEQQAKILYNSHLKSPPQQNQAEYVISQKEPALPISNDISSDVQTPQKNDTPENSGSPTSPYKESEKAMSFSGSLPDRVSSQHSPDQTMKLIFVDPKTLICPDTRITADLDQEKLDQLRASISKEGIKQPITCNRINNELIIIDGLHRAQLAEECHINLVPVVEISGNIEQNLIDNFVTNHIRGKINPSQMINVLETLEKQYGFNLEKFSEITGYSRSWLKKLTNIVHASPYVKSNLDRGKINISQAASIATLPTHKVQDRTLDIVRTSWRDAKKTESFVREIHKELQKPKPEQVEVERIIVKDSCQCCGDQFPIDELEVIRIHRDHLSTFYNVIRNAQEILKAQNPVG
jgi:ParB-like chromosome segregation protein Spo0J